MKVGIGQIDTTACDIAGNAQKILDAAQKLKDMGADFAIFPELALVGYTPKDAVLRKAFVEKSQLNLSLLAEKLPLPSLVGYIRKSGGAIGAYNSAAWIENGKIKDIYDKALFPNYDVFDEPRVFDSGKKECIVEFCGVRMAITICEDIWTLYGIRTAGRYSGFKPLQGLRDMNFNADGTKKADKAFDLLLNISASVFSRSNDNVRKSGAMMCKVSDYVGVPLVWANLVGGNDDIIFAGGSGVFAGQSITKSGRDEQKCLKKFSEDLRVVDPFEICSQEGDAADYSSIADIHSALVLGIKDFVYKSGFSKVVLGLSGGIDSALVATLAAEALGPKNVMGVAMPSAISSSHSVSDAEELARNLGIEYRKVPIAPVVSGADEALKEIFKGLKPDVTEENIQSRARGLVLMAISNKFGSMLLSTGNKSECAVGYCTLYGDTCGGLSPISDLYKTEVYELSRYINRNGIVIPQNTIDKPPSAELRVGQKDQDSLPPYDILDEILRLYIEEMLPESEICQRGFDKAVVSDVIGKVERNEYKRKQFAYGLKVSPLAFGTGRRMPLARKINKDA